MRKAVRKNALKVAVGSGEPSPQTKSDPGILLKLEEGKGQSVALLSKSLSDENRLRILLCLSSRKKSVTSIVEELGLSQPLVSHHLKELRRCLLVAIERSGPFIYYRLTDPRILDVVRILDSMAMDLVAGRKTI